MHDVAAIVLAAGLSRRMGADNKLLLPIRGVPMIRHMVDIYQGVAEGAVYVVTGHEAEAVAACLAGTDVTLVHNPGFADGQPGSVATGLQAVGPARRILIGLGDQPRLTRDDLNTLLDAHAMADPHRISIPKRGDVRGNPIVVPESLRDRLLADPRSPGCKGFTRAHPEHVQFHDLTSEGYFFDVDTPEAYATLNQSISEPMI